jgi:hypothetical protein
VVSNTLLAFLPWFINLQLPVLLLVYKLHFCYIFIVYPQKTSIFLVSMHTGKQLIHTGKVTKNKKSHICQCIVCFNLQSKTECEYRIKVLCKTIPVWKCGLLWTNHTVIYIFTFYTSTSNPKFTAKLLSKELNCEHKKLSISVMIHLFTKTIVMRLSMYNFNRWTMYSMPKKMYCTNICNIFLKWINNPGNNKCLMVEVGKEFLDTNSTSSVFKCLP